MVRPAPEPVALLAWSEVELGESYRLSVDFNVTRDDVMLSIAFDESGLTATNHALTDLELGKYYWRVAAVNEGGMQGRYSPLFRFSVIEPPAPERAPPVLVVDALEALGPVAHLAGRTDPGASLTLDGHRVRVGPDGTFAVFFKREHANVLVQITGADGQLTERELALGERQ